MSRQDSDDQIAAVRAFTRFYTRKLGVLDQQLLESPFSLSEARVLYELAHREDLAAKEIGIELGLDPGYLSRIVQNFDEKRLITRKPLEADRRQYLLSLTARGRQAFARLDRSSHDEVAAMLAALPRGDGQRLIAAIAGFEALVAEIAAKFLSSFDVSLERCWIADIDGSPVGSVFLVRHTDDIAKLRLLLVDPAGRGQGLGRRLVGECIGFARACGYRKITLWTQSILVPARKIYQDAGFALVASEPHRSFGQSLIGETWEREL